MHLSYKKIILRIFYINFFKFIVFTKCIIKPNLFRFHGKDCIKIDLCFYQTTSLKDYKSLFALTTVNNSLIHIITCKNSSKKIVGEIK